MSEQPTRPTPVHLSLALEAVPGEPMDEHTREVVASYLDGGHILTMAAGLGDDRISGEHFRTPMGLATDGVYVWGLAVAYYVRTYGLAPTPDEFTARAIDNGGRCPEVSHAEAAAIWEVVTGESPRVDRRSDDDHDNPFATA